MRKWITVIALAVATVAVAIEYTATTRIDKTSEPGVTYIGEAMSDHPATSTNTVASLEKQAVWMIVKITGTNILHSGGSAFKFNQVWTNRLNVEYK